MSKILWRDKDQVELNKAVDRFNKKVDYWQKKGQTILPEKVKISEIKSNISSRKDFNREINKLKRFGERGAEQVKVNSHGVQVTAYELREYNIDRSIRNRSFNQRKKELGNIKIDAPGFDEPLTRAEMGRVSERELRPIKNRFEKARTKSEFLDAAKTARKQSDSSFWEDRDELYKENFLKSIDNELGQNEKTELLKTKIKSMTGSEFYKFTLSHLDVSIGFVYSPIDIQVKTDHLLSVFGVSSELEESSLTTRMKSSSSSRLT